MSAVLHPSAELGPVSLRISNLARSIPFYTEVIGLKMLRQQGKRAELTADGRSTLVILHEIADPLPKVRAAGLYHFAILLPDRVSLGLSLRNLLTHNISVGQGDHLVSEALYINDPDGNGIEIYADRPRNTWKRRENGEYVMTTDPVDIEGLLALSDGLKWTGMPEATVMGHVHFHVSDLAEARRFYCDILGFEVTAAYGEAALFVAAGGYHHHVGLNTWAGVGIPNTPRNGVGIEHFTIQLPNNEEVEAVLSRLREAGHKTEQRDGVWCVLDPTDIWVRLVAA